KPTADSASVVWWDPVVLALEVEELALACGWCDRSRLSDFLTSRKHYDVGSALQHSVCLIDFWGREASSHEDRHTRCFSVARPRGPSSSTRQSRSDRSRTEYGDRRAETRRSGPS